MKSKEKKKNGKVAEKAMGNEQGLHRLAADRGERGIGGRMMTRRRDHNRGCGRRSEGGREMGDVDSAEGFGGLW
ncbi:hypothetical protein AB6A40_003574 [Gnathostoma spinigerum]|uniref:Uncharacterized protein n=1 Tax=Gnathostoma spinigerum TaxID=75299 RepID=A0ABD6E9Z0_9BILA